MREEWDKQRNPKKIEKKESLMDTSKNEEKKQLKQKLQTPTQEQQKSPIKKKDTLGGATSP